MNAPRRARAAARIAAARLLAALLSATLLAFVPVRDLQAATRRQPFVLLLSIDGLKPEAVLDASEHGLKVPNLRALLIDGSYATGVRGVMPTVTYPSHTTLLTGVSPARHGIHANTTFDPLRSNQRGWYWYSEDVRVATLWDAASQAHLSTANVHWPVSVGAHITWNLPQIWRTGSEDDLKLQRALGTPDLERSLTATLGRYPGGEEETVSADEIRMRFAIRLLELHKPDFMTVYMTGLDTQQHATGPFSPEANAVLERIDAQVGALRAAANRVAPGRAILCVVSDHGFAAIGHDVNLLSAFIQAGLVEVDGTGAVTAWKAAPWAAGGSIAIVLADPADAAVRQRVQRLLEFLAADPSNGIERILSAAEIAAAGGFPEAAFLVALRSGYEYGDHLSGPLISAPGNQGMHGYPPDHPDMRSAFFLVGPGIPAGHTLGEIDMRQIAPTLARILQVSLPAAEQPALELH
jgi:predicted AlkP superfamily pyrophosphatase or phosphodiesterase